MTSNDSKLICRNLQRIRQIPVAAVALSISVLPFLPGCSSQIAFLNGRKPEVAVRDVSPNAVDVPTDDQDGHISLRQLDNGDETIGRARLDNHVPEDSSVRSAMLTQDSADDADQVKIIPLSHRTTSSVDDTDSHVFTAAEPRTGPAFGRMSPSELYPDEYLADGGDRQLPVHYFGGSRQGLETEDTVAEYSDHRGESHVRASNRVAIYSPRFGSVRVVEGTDSGTQIQYAVKTTESSSVGSLERDEAIHQSVAEESLAAAGSWRKVDGSDAHKSAAESSATSRPQRTDKADQGLQAESVNGMQILEREQGTRFHQELANAAVWSREQFPKLSGATAQAAQTQTRMTAQSTVGIDDQRARNSEVHIIKLADHDSAKSGDIIRFTIRFINTGDYDLHDVRIVDNLTPRLQFIQDSVQTDREGDVVTKPNGEGSEILTFVLDAPLPAHQSGTIKFEVRVK